MVDLTKLSAARLQARYDKTLYHNMEATRKLIEAGRGSEHVSETRRGSDPLSLKWVETQNAFDAIAAEMVRRRAWHGTLRPIRERP